MEKVSCIKHREKSSFLKVHDDYLDLLSRNFCAAVVLAIFEYWTNSEIAKLTKEKKAEDPWMEASIPELYTEMLGMYSMKSIQEAVKLLETSPYLKVERRGGGLLNRYLLNQKALNKALNPDGKITASENYLEEIPSAKPSVKLPLLNNRDSEVEERTISSVGFPSDENYTDQDLLRAYNSQKGCHAGPKQREYILAFDRTGLTIEQAVEKINGHFQNGFHRRIGGGGREDMRASQRRPRATRTEIPLHGPWDDDEGYQEFLRRYKQIGGPYNPYEDYETHPLWEEFTEAEKVHAQTHVLTQDGAYVLKIINYFRKREFLRPPRPEPKSASQKLLDMA